MHIYNLDCCFVKATLERSETDTRQRLNSQLEKQEQEISQLQKRLENEVEQRHLLSRNQEVCQVSSQCDLVSVCLCNSVLKTFMVEGNVSFAHCLSLLRSR